MSLLHREECLDLYYRYSPVMIQHSPTLLIDSLIQLSTEINFDILIPSIVHFDHSVGERNHKIDGVCTVDRKKQCKEILRLLEYCVYQLKTSNSLVHNYFLALSIQFDPDRVLVYLNDISDMYGTQLPYDVRYAARICLQNNVPLEALVTLLITIGAYEEAIEQTLALDNVQLAKQTAEKIKNKLNSQNHYEHHNQDLVKRLWLKIAKYVINSICSKNDEKTATEFDISMATNILDECSLLKIEDILPYFPEYLTIDHCKSAICQSLEEYNSNIEQLREDMKLATESAEQIRAEIFKTRDRFVLIDSSKPCNICSFPGVQEHFYSFPSCGHLFHHKCLINEIVDYLEPENRKKLDSLLVEMKSIQNHLQNMPVSSFQSKTKYLNENLSVDSSLSLVNRLENLSSQIEALIGFECLFCGNLMVQTIDKPFIDSKLDFDEIISFR
ncbi:Vacuolar protein sorting-associated protein 18 -like protein [Sarcoptes scabiei]|uniref:Vacuolar protein sorting-associated protein 18 -like protein n=1 Tax=Sarcoptes scabiei TaxID=52283 RepID=A0A834RKC0_SARSC|nr:Vacuolar protein sorting-associated protein 18 -like protein [Sarcoptes scabiei]